MQQIFMLLMITMLASCMAKPAKNYYADNYYKIISVDSSTTPGVVYKHSKHNDLNFYDTIVNNKLQRRAAFLGELLMYKYPISPEDVSPVKYRIRGKKDHLTLHHADTITILNSLPPINQSLYTKGAGFKRLSSFRIVITPTDPAVDTVWLFLQGDHAYAEITDKMAFKDSVGIVVYK